MKEYVNIKCNSREQWQALTRVFRELGCSFDETAAENEPEFQGITHVGIEMQSRWIYWGDESDEKESIECGEQFYEFEEAMENPNFIMCIIELIK